MQQQFDPSGLKLQLEDLLQQTTKQIFSEPAQYNFRGSSLPYCAIRDTLTRCLESVDRLPSRTVPLQNQLYMDFGTVIHHNFQRALGMQGVLFGHWVCSRCRNLRENLLGPQVCCKRPMDYKEIHVESHELDFRGSVDALIKLRNSESYLLVDFKSTDKKKIGKSIKLNHRHRLQVCGYHYLLVRPPYNFNISGQAIAYIGREDVTKIEVVPLETDEFADEEFLRYCKHRQLSKLAVKTGLVSDLPALCSKPSDDPYCPYTGYCFGPNRAENLNNVWKESKLNKEKTK